MVNIYIILIRVTVVALVHVVLPQQSYIHNNDQESKLSFLKHDFIVVYVSSKDNSDFSNQECLV